MKTLLRNTSQIFAFLLIVNLLFAFSTVIYAQEFEDEEFVQGDGNSQKINDDQAVKLFNQGQDAHSKGKLKIALDLYLRALKLKPDFIEAEYQKATILTSFGRLEEAERSFRRTLTLKKDWTLALVGLGSVLNRRSQFPEAEVLLAKSIRIDRLYLPAYEALAITLIRSKASPDKLRALKNQLAGLAKEIDLPASIWISRGMLENALQDNLSAKISFGQALLIDRRNPEALKLMIDSHIIAREPTPAILLSKFLISFRPNDPEAKLLLARSYVADEKPEQALEVLDSFEKPYKAAMALKTAITSDRSEDPEILQKLLENDQNNVSVLGRLCSVMRIKDPLKALEYCRRALELDKNNVNYAAGYGAALVQLKKYRAAITVLRGLLKYDAENYTVRANLATALFQM
ncbi:MAG: hypothetical protein HKN25_12575, partial [Pyrinomonadaceae bacterium]|nr:hypothetical protein [Pyrinomonadaceae bacterium]